MGKIIEIGDTIRIEDGPPRKKAIATAELLDDKITKHHYQKGRFDAMGKPIILGEEMTYLDYYGEHVFYVYALAKVGIDKNGVIILPGDKTKRDTVKTEVRWLPVGIEKTEEKARSFAEGL